MELQLYGILGFDLKQVLEGGSRRWLYSVAQNIPLLASLVSKKEVEYTLGLIDHGLLSQRLALAMTKTSRGIKNEGNWPMGKGKGVKEREWKS